MTEPAPLPPPPLPVQLASSLLWSLAALSVLTGLSVSALLAVVPLLDPTLPSAWDLAVFAGAVGLLGTLVTVGVIGTAAAMLPTGQPWARRLATVAAAIAVLTPLAPLALWTLYLLYGAVEAKPWFARMRALHTGAPA